MKEKYKSELLESLHETAIGLHKIGVIDDKEMQEYNHDCLAEKPELVNKTDGRAKAASSAR